MRVDVLGIVATAVHLDQQPLVAVVRDHGRRVPAVDRQALVLGAKCRALVAGRPSASIDDIRSIAAPSLRHRMILNFEGEAEGLTTDQIIENILSTVPVQAAA